MVISESPAIASLNQLILNGEPSRAEVAPDPPDGAARRRVVNVTGRGAAVAFVIDEYAPMDEVARELGAQLSAPGALYSAGGVSVNTGSRVLDAGEKDAIRRVFAENSGLQVARFVSSSAGGYAPDASGYAADAGGYPPEPPSFPRPAPRDRDYDAGAPRDYGGRGIPTSGAFAGLARGEQRNRAQALLIRATFRSGESVNHRGDVVVLGDMNPGSEILADGDIVVMGTVHGLPHAGASGDDKAAIIALELASPRIRIGMCEAEAPASARRQGRKRSPGPLRIAYARRGGIYVAPFAGRFARYTKGVPYDG